MPKPSRIGPVTTAADLEAPSSALRLAAELRGNEAARLIQLGRVYTPQPPFDSSTLETAPADAGAMTQPARPQGEGVITGRMWMGICFVGVVMATGTLLVLDASLPGGLIDGSGNMRYAQTMALTTLVLFQLFNVFNARSDERSAFSGLFKNSWLWGAVLLSLTLHVAVIYVPFLQQAFSTVSLSASDWLRCALVASSVLWLRELSKLMGRVQAKPQEPAQTTKSTQPLRVQD